MVVTALWRGLGVFRPIAWLYAVYSTYVRHPDLNDMNMARSWLAWVVLGVLGAWTVSMVLYRVRNPWVVGLELVLACAAVMSTRLVDTADLIAGGAQTLPGFWPAAAVLGWAVLKGWRAGLLAAFLVGLADILEAGVLSGHIIDNIVILVLLGGCVGYCADLSRDGHEALREALRAQAERHERDRLARTVHDGVLQALSYIHRRGVDLGGQARELGSMAAAQERRLRILVSDVSGPQLGGAADEEVDLRMLLGRYAEDAVDVVPPAEPVIMPRRVADELASAVSAALDNVRSHAGGDAQAWVLIEDQGKDVTVTIRDNGVGVLACRLAQAAAHGRLGVANSIRGRIIDLGGTVTFDSTPGAGTRLELTVPRDGRS